MKEYLSIKEFSEFTQIEQSTLRYWDDIGLFPPAMRDPNNNYRYYSPQQIIGVNFISVLSELDFPLKTIANIKKERTPEKIMDLIAEHDRCLDMEMHKLREKYSIVHARQKLIHDGIMHEDGEIAVMHKGEMAYLRGPKNRFSDEGNFYQSFINFCTRTRELRINLSFPVGGIHESIDSFEHFPGSPDYFFSYDPIGNMKSPAGDYLVGFTKGYYGQLGDLPKRMLAYAQKHDLSLSAPVFTLCLHDEICITDPAQLLSQVLIPIALPVPESKKSRTVS